MARAKVSVCFMVRDEEASGGLLEECLASVRPYVEEIVILDTGSKDATPEIAKKYADVFEVFTDCNHPETGVIEDFSKARNRSFDLARQPWVMWLDSDDVLAGGEHIAKLVEIADANKGDRDWCYLFPYEYVYSPEGKCVCLHYRERLISRRASMRWVNPVHEVMVPEEGSKLVLVPCDDVVVKHQRQRSKKSQESGRNLRILQKMVEVDGSTDPRQFYYLGLEYANANQLDKAREWLGRYVGVSGWDDEKTMAALKLAELCYAQGRVREGIVWAFRAVETREGWGEGYFALARGFFLLATNGPISPEIRRNWEKCAHFARMGLSLPPTKTMLFVNPVERDVDVHVYLTMALSQLGDARAALKHADEAYKATPSDPNLVYNRKIFQRLVAQEDAKLALDKLVEAEGLSTTSRDGILSALKDGAGVTADGWPLYEKPPGYPKNVEDKHFPIARVAPHARAFALPESVDIDDLPVRMTDAQVEAATLLVWKEYVLHDEILAAESFLANAPYRARHTVEVERALTRTRNMTTWMGDHVTEQQFNSPADPTIENGVALPHPLNGQVEDRSRLGLATLAKTDRVLDLGCFDGGIVNRWALAGYDVTGVDLCEGSIALAKRKAEEFKTGAKFIVSKFNELELSSKYDVVTCCDTYEHVKDAVKDLIAPARRALKDDGRMVITTPHGAWMRGQYIAWAHPWRWADEENRVWNTDLPHAHLIAPTPWSVAEHFRSDGWWVKDSYVVESASHQDVPGQGNVYAEARLVAPRATEPLDIVFACGDAWEEWNPLVHKEHGIGGSETMVVEMAKRLALAGHRVRVFTSTGKYGEGVFDGVEYRQTGHLMLGGSCDVFIAWRNASILGLAWKADLRLLWVHDVFAGAATHRNLLKADRILALSEWHKGFMVGHHNLAPEHVRVTRNGIDLSRFDEVVERNPHKMVYSSSPDRGLPALLAMWPKIRERVPDAELHVFYGFDNWEKAALSRGDEAQLRAIRQLVDRMHALSTEGVVYRGKVDQKTLAREFLSAGVWGYPTWFSETSCLTAMEAQAAGLRIVTSAIAALEETAGYEHCVLLEGDWLSEPYQTAFIEEVERALTAPERAWTKEGDWMHAREEIQARARRDFGLDALAADWVKMFAELRAGLRVSPLVPYKGRADFTRGEAA
jgi:2-polyprenyl-3-methyl-5-hydroxy-6-metoxy-1,4-benzoquinol methylase/glycosyltransferase involved in cell wall biosynthesis